MKLVTGFITGLFILGIASSVKAAPISGQGTWETTLQGRDLDGNVATFEAYYDTVLDITWLADAYYAKTSGYDSNGRMTWADAKVWAAGLDPYGSGVTGWRLPENQPMNGTTYNNTFVYDGSTDRGYNISAPGTAYAGSTASEMAHMYYNTLSNIAQQSCLGCYNTNYGMLNTGPFSNLLNGYVYWSGTEYFYPTLDLVYGFFSHTGTQSYTSKSSDNPSWAVHDGDVSAVPIPAAIWLFGSGLIGLIGVARRKKS